LIVWRGKTKLQYTESGEAGMPWKSLKGKHHSILGVVASLRFSGLKIFGELAPTRV
jgi:hypothetical protein